MSTTQNPQDQQDTSKTSLQGKTENELRQIARQKGITDADTKSKDDLVAELADK